MAKTKIALDDILHIVFWDHCENHHDAIQFEVYGKLVAVTRKAYILGCWIHHTPEARAADNSDDKNEHRYAIVKSAIESIRKLK